MVTPIEKAKPSTQLYAVRKLMAHGFTVKYLGIGLFGARKGSKEWLPVQIQSRR
jgi:hypothetical protein